MGLSGFLLPGSARIGWSTLTGESEPQGLSGQSQRYTKKKSEEEFDEISGNNVKVEDKDVDGIAKDSATELEAFEKQAKKDIKNDKERNIKVRQQKNKLFLDDTKNMTKEQAINYVKSREIALGNEVAEEAVLKEVEESFVEPKAPESPKTTGQVEVDKDVEGYLDSVMSKKTGEFKAGIEGREDVHPGIIQGLDQAGIGKKVLALIGEPIGFSKMSAKEKSENKADRIAMLEQIQSHKDGAKLLAAAIEEVEGLDRKKTLPEMATEIQRWISAKGKLRTIQDTGGTDIKGQHVETTVSVVDEDTVISGQAEDAVIKSELESSETEQTATESEETFDVPKTEKPTKTEGEAPTAAVKKATGLISREAKFMRTTMNAVDYSAEKKKGFEDEIKSINEQAKTDPKGASERVTKLKRDVIAAVRKAKEDAKKAPAITEKNTKKEIYAKAKKEGIELPKNATKAELIKAYNKSKADQKASEKVQTPKEKTEEEVKKEQDQIAEDEALKDIPQDVRDKATEDQKQKLFRLNSRLEEALTDPFSDDHIKAQEELMDFIKEIRGQKPTKTKVIDQEAANKAAEKAGAVPINLEIDVESEVSEESVAVSEEAAKKKTETKVNVQKRSRTRYQSKDASNFEKISSNKSLADRLVKRLNKHFGDIISATAVEGLIEHNGKEYMGMAIGTLIAWSKTDGRVDTIPHEYAHVYVELMRDSRIVKDGILLFGSEEALVQHIGEYYANKMQENSDIYGKLKNWLRQFVKRLAVRFRLIKQDADWIGDFIAEEMFAGLWVGRKYAKTRAFASYSEAVSESNEKDTMEPVGVFTSEIPSEARISDMFLRMYGMHIGKDIIATKIPKIARAAQTYEQFEEDLTRFLTEYAEASKLERPDRSTFLKTEWTKEKGMSEERAALTMLWFQTRQKIKSFVPGVPARMGKDTRIYMALIQDDTAEGVYNLMEAFEPFDGDGKEHSEGKYANDPGFIHPTKGKMPDSRTTNFVEEDQIAGNHDERLLHLPVEHQLERKRGKRKKDGKVYDFLLDMTRHHGAEVYQKIEQSEVYGSAISEFLEQEQGAMLFILGAATGEGKAVLFGRASDAVLDSTHDQLLDGLKVGLKEGVFGRDNELAKQNWGFIQAATGASTSEANILLKQLGKEITEGNTLKMLDAIQNAKMRQMVARINALQTMYHKFYIADEKSIGDTFARLQLPLTEGITPAGIGEQRIMTVPKNADVYINGEWIGTYNDMDGTTFSSQNFFKKLSTILYKPIGAVKSVFRDRSPDGIDYIGVKHMQHMAYDNMEIREGNKLIAKIEDGNWIDSRGQEFDHIMSNNEAKIKAGRFVEEKKIETIPESAMKIIKLPKDHNAAASPIAAFEGAISGEMRKTEAGRKVIEVMSQYYKDLSYNVDNTGYADLIHRLRTNYKEFVKVFQTIKEEGKLQPEMQVYLELLEETKGQGVHFPKIIEYFTGMMNNRFIIDGVFKGKAMPAIFKELKQLEAWDIGTNLYLKPGGNMVKDGNVIISADNKVALDYVLKKYRERGGENVAKDEWTDASQMVGFLNTWLLDNEVRALIHRQPISDSSGIMTMRVQSLLEGGHDQSLIASTNDVKSRFNGDWDGDGVLIEFLPDEQMNAIEAWQKTTTFQKTIKNIVIDIYGKRFEDQEDATGFLDDEARFETLSSTIGSQGALGYIVSSRNIMFALDYKNFVLTPKNKKSTYKIYAKDPDELTTMDYMALDPEQALAFYYDVVSGEDQIVDENDQPLSTQALQDMVDMENQEENPPKAYFRTTRRNEFAYLLQFAVDDPKYGLLSKLFTDQELKSPKMFHSFMINRMFEKLNNETGEDMKLEPNEIQTLKDIRSFQNFSTMRHGKYKDKRGRADFGGNYANSQQMYEIYNDDNGERRSAKDTSSEYTTKLRAYIKNNFEYRKHKSMTVGFNVGVNDNMTPAEVLLSSFREGYQYMFNKQGSRVQRKGFDKLDTNNPVMFSPIYYQYAATATANWLRKKWGETFNTRANKKAYEAGYNFIYKKDPTDGKSMIEKFWEIYKAHDEAINNEESILFEYNEEIAKFEDDFLHKWMMLGKDNPEAQQYATWIFLTVPYNRYKSSRLLPIRLMEPTVLTSYLKIYDHNLKMALTRDDLSKVTILGEERRAKTQAVKGDKLLRGVRDKAQTELDKAVKGDLNKLKEADKENPPCQ